MQWRDRGDEAHPAAGREWRGCGRPSRASARSAREQKVLEDWSYGSEDDRVRRGSQARPRTRHEPASRRGEGNPRPKAGTWCLRRSGSPTITNDGVSIAKEIELETVGENRRELVKEVAKKTDDVAVTARRRRRARPGARPRGLRNVAAGANRCRSSAHRAAVERVSEELSKLAKDVETKEQIASTLHLRGDTAIAR